jgi:hypothetical protein
MKLWKLLTIEGSVLMYIGSPLRPGYTGERRTIFAKAYGMKVRCLGTRWGTYWEPIGNLEGTPWEHVGKQGKMKKKSFPPSKLKSKAPWDYLLAERKTNPLSSPPPPKKNLHGQSSVHLDTGQSTIHTKYNLKKKPPLQAPTNTQIGGPNHLSY